MYIFSLITGEPKSILFSKNPAKNSCKCKLSQMVENTKLFSVKKSCQKYSMNPYFFYLSSLQFYSHICHQLLLESWLSKFSAGCCSLFLVHLIFKSLKNMNFKLVQCQCKAIHSQYFKCFKIAFSKMYCQAKKGECTQNTPQS